MSPEPLVTQRLVLRMPGIDDLDPFTAYCMGPRTAFVGGPFDAVESFNKLASLIGHWHLRGFGRYVMADAATGRGLGHVGALCLDIQSEPEMTWTIWDEADERRGFAYEASRAYLDNAKHLFGFSTLVARVLPDNEASRRLAIKLGGILDDQSPPPDWYPESLAFRFDL